MQLQREKLKAKGWSEEEPQHATHILSKAARKKHPHQNALNEAVFFTILLIGVFSVIAVTWWLLPILVLAGASISYPILALIGCSFGMLLYIVVKDLDHLQTHHHTILSITLPLSSMLGYISILTRAKALFLIDVAVGTLIIGGAVFTLALLAPYIYHRIHE